MRLLAVDDDPVTLRLITGILSASGHEISTAEDGIQALKIINERGLDIIVMDWEMPGMKGIDLCRTIRSLPWSVKPYVIMLTGKTLREDMLLGFGSGVDDFMTKPVDPDELLARVRVGERIVRLQQELEGRANFAEARFRDLFDNSPSGILLIKCDGTISQTDFVDVNKSLCTMLDFGLEEFKDISLLNFVHPSDREKVSRLISLNGKSSTEARLVKKGGDPVWASINAFDLGNSRLLIVEDISREKLNRQRSLMRTMRYKVEEGGSYKSHDPQIVIEAFSDAISAGFHGIVFSRREEREFRRLVQGKFDHHWIAEKGPNGSVRPDTDAILNIIDGAPNHEIFLLDGLDHIYHMRGFKEAFVLVSGFRERALMKDSIAMISMDISSIPETDHASLGKECEELLPLITTKLDDALMDVMRSVYLRESRFMEASLGTITEELNISRPTARKRINSLLKFDYLFDRKKGRTRVLTLSEKGKRLFGP